jgi:hypothetical protein
LALASSITCSSVFIDRDHRLGVPPGWVAQPRAVAVDDLTNQVADNRRRCRLGKRGGEQSLEPPAMRISAVGQQRRSIAEDRCRDHAGLDIATRALKVRISRARHSLSAWSAHVDAA